MIDDFSFRIDSVSPVVLFGYDDSRDDRRVLRKRDIPRIHIGNCDHRSLLQLVEVDSRIQLGEKLSRDVKFFREQFERRCVTETAELRLLIDAFRNRRERSGDIARRYRVMQKQRSLSRR